MVVLTERLKFVPTLIESGKLKANPIAKQLGGLHKINEGLDLIKAGKVRTTLFANRIRKN